MYIFLMHAMYLDVIIFWFLNSLWFHNNTHTDMQQNMPTTPTKFTTTVTVDDKPPQVRLTSC